MDLTPTRFATLQRLFEQALTLPAAERAAFLEANADGDITLREEVLALVNAHESSSTALNQPVAITDTGAPPDENVWLDRRLGPWRVTRVIGIGGMGAVYEAVRADEQFEKRAAVKFLHWHSRLPVAQQRFRAERQILANLDHPNVATLLDGGVTEEGTPYLVMEYIDGEPITTWANANSLGRRERVELFTQVCAAVEAAHRNLIVHRDLKPGNILVTRDGRAKLLDFGIARLLDDTSPEFVASRSSEPLSFTPDYAAPEQMRALPVSTATDVFALGVVLYQMLAGRLPFPRLDAADKHASRDTPAAPAGVDPDLDAILARALRLDPAQRYASVQELRADLARWLDGRTVSAHPDSRRYRFSKFVRRHRVGAVLVSVATLAILTATGVAIWQAQVARRAAADLQQYNDFLMSVLRMSDPFNEGEELTLSAALDHAAERIDERFATRPDLSAAIRFGIGYSMASRYRLEQADVQLARALQDSAAVFGEDDIRTLRVLEGVAGLRLEQNRFSEAVKDYRRVLERLEAGGLTRDPLYAKALGNLGNVYLQLEKYPEADELLRRTLAEEERTGHVDPLDHANLLSNLAHSAHGLEQLERADALYREARAAFEKLFPGGSPDLAILMNNHAMLYEDHKDYAGALRLYLDSLAIRRKVFRGEHPMIVTALSNVARLEIVTGDVRAAAAHAREGAAMADRVYTAPNRFHPSVHATLASTQVSEGDFAGADRSLQRARDLLAKQPEPPPSVVEWVAKVRGQLCERIAKETTRPPPVEAAAAAHCAAAVGGTTS